MNDVLFIHDCDMDDGNVDGWMCEVHFNGYRVDIISHRWKVRRLTGTSILNL
jgi:hypothetical protein